LVRDEPTRTPARVSRGNSGSREAMPVTRGPRPAALSAVS